MTTGPISEIVEFARWAPSGDNSQPWRFETVDDHHLVVHAHDTRADCVYDLDGRSSQLAVGALLETIALAATAFGLEARVERRADAPDSNPVFDVRFAASPEIERHPLVNVISARAVNRGPYRTRNLTADEKARVEAAARPDHRVVW